MQRVDVSGVADDGECAEEEGDVRGVRLVVRRGGVAVRVAWLHESHVVDTQGVVRVLGEAAVGVVRISGRESTTSITSVDGSLVDAAEAKVSCHAL